MVKELEQTRFRPGENAKKPWGGKVSNEPFPSALYRLASEKGYPSQRALAIALGKGSGNSPIGNWYTGEYIPTQKEFDPVVRLLNLDDEERQMLVELRSEALEKRKKETALKKSNALRKPAVTPVGLWFQEFMLQRDITFRNLSDLLGLEISTIHTRSLDNAGLPQLSKILQQVPQKLNLTEEETNTLQEAVKQTIEQKRIERESRERVPNLSPRGTMLRKIQSSLPYKTYTAVQAAEILGAHNRQRIRQLRKKLGLPVLLTPGDIEILRPYVERQNVKKQRNQLA